MILNFTIKDDRFDISSANISSALEQAKLEVENLDETIDSVKKLRPECDKLDYVLAACSGALCGLIDIFLVGKPEKSEKPGKSEKSILGEITDKWFEDRTKDFAKLCGWNGEGEASALRFLENKFKVPYDQRGCGDAGSSVFDLKPLNHHFKSLGHNPTICGLFFSILDQFQNTSHFVSGGQLISLENAASDFKLRGNDIAGKFFCGFVNWFGHLMSDVSGSSGSIEKGNRGMGIPSPFWAWTNDIIAIKNSLGIKVSKFDETVNELAISIYNQGFDARFQAAQAIPVFINEMIVRIVYAVRRLIKYFATTQKEERSFGLMWRTCEPFSNATVKRMLTVAHGTFCVLDIGDATVRSVIAGHGTFAPTEFFLRFNLVGIGRFSISLYGEGKRIFGLWRAEKKADFARREKAIIDDYIEGLRILADKYDDRMLMTFVDDLQKSDMYISAFNKTVKLAELREVPEERILRSKSDIDKYFQRR